jgi:hypothetical protein
MKKRNVPAWLRSIYIELRIDKILKWVELWDTKTLLMRTISLGFNLILFNIWTMIIQNIFFLNVT